MATTPSDPTVILSYARTPMGAMQGALADVSATELGATAVKAAVERAGVSGDQIDRIYMGCVLPAGLGQAPARQAALKAGLPKSVQATTVNKVCGSGMQTVIGAAQFLAGGMGTLAVAGGMENMSQAPHVIWGARTLQGKFSALARPVRPLLLEASYPDVGSLLPDRSGVTLIIDDQSRRVRRGSERTIAEDGRSRPDLPSA